MNLFIPITMFAIGALIVPETLNATSGQCLTLPCYNARKANGSRASIYFTPTRSIDGSKRMHEFVQRHKKKKFENRPVVDENGFLDMQALSHYAELRRRKIRELKMCKVLQDRNDCPLDAFEGYTRKGDLNIDQIDGVIKTLENQISDLQIELKESIAINVKWPIIKICANAIKNDSLTREQEAICKSHAPKNESTGEVEKDWQVYLLSLHDAYDKRFSKRNRKPKIKCPEPTAQATYDDAVDTMFLDMFELSSPIMDTAQIARAHAAFSRLSREEDGKPLPNVIQRWNYSNFTERLEEGENVFWFKKDE